MQTFVPYGAEFEANAYVLDVKRLGKQRVEGLQILNALAAWRRGEKAGWVNHPAVKMWRCHDAALVVYTLEMCERWKSLGFSDTVAETLGDIYPQTVRLASESPEAIAMPPWLYDEAVMLSHRSNLVRKNPIGYRPWWPDIPNDLPYVWPVR